MALMTLEQAKDHLRITHDDADADVQLKLEQASAIVMTYIREPGSPPWTDEDVPGPVQTVALLALTYLHEHRGDGPQRQEVFWESVKQMLIGFGYTDPTLA